MQPKVYAVNAKLPFGGAYMVYHIGRMIHQRYGYAFINLPFYQDNKPSPFSYDIPMETMDIHQVKRQITNRDILICSPIMAQKMMLGNKIPGKKIMYIQGIDTFQELDKHYNVYAFTSSKVRDVVTSTFHVNAPVIAPFVQIDPSIPIKPWNQRPEDSAVVYLKTNRRAHFEVYEQFKQSLSALYPSLKTELILSKDLASHDDLLAKIATARYLFNTSAIEGFGLVPLEAMCVGTIPFGLDGLSGVDYMKYGKNSFCLPYKDFTHENLKQLISDMQYKGDLAIDTEALKQQYSQQRFYDEWDQLLKQKLGLE